MILNSGLDAACTTTSIPATGGNAPRFGQFIRYACIGTGSSAPDPSDTTLDSQVGSRTDNRGGFNNSESAGKDNTANLMWYEGTFTRVFDIDSNVNAAEWGLAPQPSGNLSVRELFRADPNDDQSSPITLTLEDGDQLQLVITFRVQAVWEYETKTFVITGTTGNDGNGTHEGAATVALASNNAADVSDTLSVCWPGGSATNYVRLYAAMTDQSTRTKSDDLSGASVSTSFPAEPYSPGDYYRDYVGSYSTSQANGDIYAVSQGVVGRGYRFIFTDPPFLTKTSTHRLTLTLRKHIARL